MKRITLLLAALLATQITFAQEEVAIEQNINKPIGCLNINAGWEVRLMHRETEGYRDPSVQPQGRHTDNPKKRHASAGNHP